MKVYLATIVDYTIAYVPVDFFSMYSTCYHRNIPHSRETIYELCNELTRRGEHIGLLHILFTGLNLLAVCVKSDQTIT